MFQEYYKNFTGGSLNFIDTFKKVYLQADPEKLQTFIADNQKLMREMVKT
jgi:hypothetical protein